MLRFAVITAVALAVLVGAKEGKVVDRANLLGTCERVATPSGNWGEWWACRDGKLAQAADLSTKSCERVGSAGGYDYWRCPASLAQGRAPL
jgi:hypothetical protein